MTDANNVADPSSATSIQYDSWDDKGTPIVSKKDPAASNAEPPKKQESAPASTPETKAQSEGEPKSAADSEAANKQERRGKKPAEDRISELVAERNQERAKVQALEERFRKLEAAAQPPSKTEQKAEAPKERKRPNYLTWTGTPEEMDTALDEWETHLLHKAEEHFAQKQQVQESKQRLDAQFAEAKEKYPDAEAKILPTIEKLESADMPPYLRDYLEHSEVLCDLLYVLSEQNVEALVRLAKENPAKAFRDIRDLEVSTAKAIAKDAKEQSKAETEEKPHNTPVEPKPRAPKPPSEVGGRSAASEDGLVTAARANSFRDFEKEMNARLMSRK